MRWSGHPCSSHHNNGKLAFQPHHTGERKRGNWPGALDGWGGDWGSILGVDQWPPPAAKPKASAAAGTARAACVDALTSEPTHCSAGNSCSALRSSPHAPADVMSALAARATGPVQFFTLALFAKMRRAIMHATKCATLLF